MKSKGYVLQFPLLFEQLMPRDKKMNYLHDSQSWNDIGHGIMWVGSHK